MGESDAPADPAPRRRRILRLAAWNGLFISIALALLSLGGEAYFRVTKPFMHPVYPHEFVPGVGLLYPPGAEVRATNRLDFWTISRANRLGFLDREPPPGPAAGCPVVIIGDSVVEAREAPLADKFHLRLEEMAAAQQPHLNLTAAAFGRGGSGQVEQLAFYDHYARAQRPRLVALVFVANDVWNNHPVLRGIDLGREPRHLPYFTVARRPDGTPSLRPPAPDYWKFKLPAPPPPPPSWADVVLNQAGQVSWFALWLKAKKENLFPPDTREAGRRAHAELLSRRPDYAPLLADAAGLSWNMEQDLADQLARGDLSPIYAEALEYTAFALAQFRERAARDGAALVIMTNHTIKARGPAIFDWLREMAAAQGLPVIDLADYIRRQGGRLADAHWRHDRHWNAQGHQWAAEALLEWIGDNEEVCRPKPPARGQRPERNR